MPKVFRWGGTTPDWDDQVDEYMTVRTFNRLCDLINHRNAGNTSGK
jgi:hypothetical protein